MQQLSLPQIQSLSQAPLATQYSSLLFTQQLSAQQPSFFPQPPSQEPLFSSQLPSLQPLVQQPLFLSQLPSFTQLPSLQHPSFSQQFPLSQSGLDPELEPSHNAHFLPGSGYLPIPGFDGYNGEPDEDPIQGSPSMGLYKDDDLYLDTNTMICPSSVLQPPYTPNDFFPTFLNNGQYSSTQRIGHKPDQFPFFEQPHSACCWPGTCCIRRVTIIHYRDQRYAS